MSRFFSSDGKNMALSSYSPVGILVHHSYGRFCEEIRPLLESRCNQIRVVVSITADAGGLSDEEVLSLQSVEILIADPKVYMGLSLSLPNLKWMQLLWAGVDALTKSADRSVIPSFIITRNGRSFVEDLAQYVFGYIFAHERRHKFYDQCQKSKVCFVDAIICTYDSRFSSEDLSQLNSTMPFYVAAEEKLDRKQLSHRKPSTSTIGILGLGVIGKEIARWAKSLHMTVWGLVRALPAEEQRSKNVDEYRVIDDLPELLSTCDYVCSVLPSTTDTDSLLDGNVLSHCKNKYIQHFVLIHGDSYACATTFDQFNPRFCYPPVLLQKSVFINVGRGNVVKNSTIIRALDEGWLEHAVLDVFESEPLPKDSELWARTDVTITPHVAGVNLDVKEFAEDFATNYRLYRNGDPMNYVVDWKKGY